MSAMPVTTGREVAERLDVVEAEVERGMDGLATLVEAQLAGPSPRRSHLDIEDHCRMLLSRSEVPLAGAGFVAASDMLVDAPYWLEWWTVDPSVGPSSCRRLAAETDPTSVGFRDYTELPWYAVPRATGRTHVTGPYVDYVCTDQHTLTTTRPVLRDGAFAGVVGVDMLAATMEELLLPVWPQGSTSCVVVNRTGRVVAASDPAWVAGDLVRGLPFEDWFSGAGVEVDGWRFVVGERSPLGVIVRG